MWLPPLPRLRLIYAIIRYVDHLIPAFNFSFTYLTIFPSYLLYPSQGHIRGKPESVVALSTCDGALDGIVIDGKQTYFIHPHIDGRGRLQDDHYLLR